MHTLGYASLSPLLYLLVSQSRPKSDPPWAGSARHFGREAVFPAKCTLPTKDGHGARHSKCHRPCPLPDRGVGCNPTSGGKGPERCPRGGGMSRALGRSSGARDGATAPKREPSKLRAES